MILNVCGTGAVQAAVVLNWTGVVLGGQARVLFLQTLVLKIDVISHRFLSYIIH